MNMRECIYKGCKKISYAGKLCRPHYKIAIEKIKKEKEYRLEL